MYKDFFFCEIHLPGISLDQKNVFRQLYIFYTNSLV